MIFQFEERASDSPLVERIWRTGNERTGAFTSLAASHRELVVMRHNGALTMTLRGPETVATTAHCAIEAEWVGIILKLGAYLPHLPDGAQPDGALDLPQATDTTFWLQGAAWEYPTFDNADAFVARLVREGLLVCDPIVDAALRHQPQTMSPRRVQQRFVRATGLSQRARYATTLLQQGVPIIETIARAGYADQAHLTRALKHFIGQTPARLLRPTQPRSTSLLFKTMAPPGGTIGGVAAVEIGGSEGCGQGTEVRG